MRAVDGRRARLLCILGGLAASALALIGWTQPWFDFATPVGSVSATGETAAPSIAALSLAGLALAVALSLAGPVFRLVFGVLQIAIAVGIGASAIAALGDPTAAAASVVTGITGVAGDRSVDTLVTAAVPTIWPAVEIAAAVLALAAGVTILATARRWPGSSRRYQATRLVPAEERTAASDWDALSGGDDPTTDDAATTGDEAGPPSGLRSGDQHPDARER